jgi:hypothetical protein
MITRWTYEKRILHSYKQPYATGKVKPMEWTPEQLEAWRNNLRRMGMTVDENTMPHTKG